MARIDELINWNEAFQSEDINKLLRNYQKPEDSGTLEVLVIRPQVEQMKVVFKWITKSRFDALPPFKQREFQQHLDDIIQNLDRLHTFKKLSNQPDDVQQRNFIEFFQTEGMDAGRYNSKINHLWSLIVESVALELANISLSERITEINQILSRAKDTEKSLDSIHKAVATKEQKETVANHATIFFDQAATHKKNARKWRIGVMWLLGADLAAISGSFAASFSVTNQIELAIFAALLISLISFTIVLSVKNYFSERHNETINQHKANCLKSFETFVTTASDPVRDAILQYTAQTIFSPFNPGYLSKDAMQSPLPIIEMLRTVYPEKK